MATELAARSAPRPNDYTLRDRGVGRDPRPLAKANRRKIARAKPVRSVDFVWSPVTRHGVGPELHLVLQDDSSPGVQPAARRDKNIAADFKAICEIDGYVPRDLKISPAAFERRAAAKIRATAGSGRRSGSQPVASADEMKPKILEHSHCPQAGTPAELAVSALADRSLFDAQFPQTHNG